MYKTNLIDSEKLNMLNNNDLDINTNLNHDKISVQIKSLLNTIINNNDQPSQKNLNNYSNKFKSDLVNIINNNINNSSSDENSKSDMKNIISYIFENNVNAHDNLKKSYQLSEVFNIKMVVRLNTILKQHLLNNSKKFVDKLTVDIISTLENAINEIKVSVYYTNMNKVSNLVKLVKISM